MICSTRIENIDRDSRLKITGRSLLSYVGIVLTFLLLTSYLLPETINTTLIFAGILLTGLPSFFLNIRLYRRGFLFLLLLLAVFQIVTSVINSSESIINEAIKSCLWFFVFNISLLFNVSSEKNSIVTITSLVFLTIFTYLIVRYHFYETIGETTNKFYTVSVSYYFLCFVPFVVSIKNKVIKTLLIVLISVLVFLSFKRGSAITLAVLLLSFLLAFYLSKKTSKKTKAVSLVFLSILLAAIVIFLFQYEDGVFLNKVVEIWKGRIIGGGVTTNSRERLYPEVVNLIFTSRPIDFFFGHGFNAVQLATSTGLSAHNDFLEIAFDYGIVSGLLYLIIFAVILFWPVRHHKSITFPYEYVAFCIILFLPGLVSHMITYQTYVYILMIFAGGLYKKCCEIR